MYVTFMFSIADIALKYDMGMDVRRLCMANAM